MPSPEQSLASNNPFRRKPGNPFPANSGPATSDSPAGTAALAFSLDGPFDPAPRPPPITTFRSAASDGSRRDNDDEQPIQPKPKKIVKKVRVQSPPPSSPEDSVPVARYPPQDSDDDEDDEGDSSSSEDSNGSRGPGEDIDPFNTTPPGIKTKVVPESTLPRTPPNPFSRTLQDVEQGQDVNEPSPATTKGSLDVNSFKQLLLTGHADTPETGGSPAGPATHPPTGTQDGASSTDASSVSRQSTLDPMPETPRTSHEISEPDEERRGVLPSSPLAMVQSTTGRKKPPPPSSRHGKLIKIELGSDSAARNKTPPKPLDTSLPAVTPSRRSSSYGSTPQSSPPLPKDVNKPLPHPPFRPATDEDVDSPFDREAAGKVPEAFANLQTNPRPPTPPPTAVRDRSGSQGSTQSRKPAAPPPRRHGRSNSRAPSINTINTDDDPSRSSMDSNLSRSDSLRGNNNAEKFQNAPAPPPPRRPHHGRQGSTFTNPARPTSSRSVTSPGLSGIDGSPARAPINLAGGGIQMENPAAMATVTMSKDGSTKLSPPPPPPTRQASSRRPHSARGVDAGSGNGGLGAARKVSKEKDGAAPPPPPPPPRLRGGSRTGTDPLAPGAEITKSPGDQVNPAPQEISTSVVAAPVVPDNYQGAEILADIDALQREVDALMGRYPKGSES